MELIYLRHCQNALDLIKDLWRSAKLQSHQTLEPLDRRTGLVGTRVPQRVKGIALLYGITILQSTLFLRYLFSLSSTELLIMIACS